MTTIHAAAAPAVAVRASAGAAAFDARRDAAAAPEGDGGFDWGLAAGIGGAAVLGVVALAVGAHIKGGPARALAAQQVVERARTLEDFVNGRSSTVPAELALADGSLAPHLIRSADVDGFLAGSQWRHTTFHNATPNTFANKVAQGPRLDKVKDALYGRGFYSSTRPDTSYGPHQMETVMRTRNPLVVQRDGFEQQIAHLVAKHPAPAGTGRETISARAQRVILAEGHDSVIVKLGPNWDHDYLVALRGEDVRIVVRDPADPRPRAATKVTLTQPPTTTTGT